MPVQDVQIVTTGLVPNTTGLGKNLSQQLPTVIYISTNDTLATVLAAGYLNESKRTYQYPYSNYQMAEVYTTDNGVVWLRVSVTNVNNVLTYSLVAPAGSADVVIPTNLNGIIYANNTAGTLTNAIGANIFNGGNISAGLAATATAAGVAGELISFPAAGVNAGKGNLILMATPNAGNTSTIFTNDAMGQATQINAPDPGNAAAQFLVAAGATPFVNNHMVVASGTAGLMADAGFQMKTVAGAAVAGGAAAQTIMDAFCTTASNVIGNWNTQANAVTVEKIVPGNGSFVVTSSADPGASTFNYIITKV